MRLTSRNLARDLLDCLTDASEARKDFEKNPNQYTSDENDKKLFRLEKCLQDLKQWTSEP